MNNKTENHKSLLGPWDAIAINIGIVIGCGIFRVPSEVAKYLTTPSLIILAWFLGGIICLLGVLCYAELSSSFPQTGGNYVYLLKSMGRMVAFLFAWTEILIIRPGSIAAVAFIFAEYLKSFLSLDTFSVKLIAIFLVLGLSIINILGLKPGKMVQNSSTYTKILALIFIILFGMISNKGSVLNFQSAEFSPDMGIFSLFGLALVPILWTYGGWHEITYVSGEIKDYKKSLSFSLIVSILVISLIYVTINIVYLYLVPIKEIVHTELIGSKVMQILWGDAGKKILEILVLISSLGCVNGLILTGSRITYAFARDNPLFRYLEKIHPKYSTPSRSIFINAILAFALIIWGTFNKLLFFTGIVFWLFFALVVSGLFVLRYRFPQIERPFKVPGYPYVPFIFILVSVSICINTLFSYPRESLFGLCLTLSGIPVFFFLQRYSIRKHF